MKKLFTERFGLTEPRIKEVLDFEAAIGIISIVRARIDEDWFGESFPLECPDGGYNAGCDWKKLKGGFNAYNIIWPLEWLNDEGQVPEDPYIFDLVEFAYEHVALPEPYDFHSFMRHDHFNYDQEKGRQAFTNDINRLFERHGLAFELVDGEVTRISPMGLHEALAEAVFHTGDDDLDRLLETAREKFLNKNLVVRKEGLEKLWDAWERLKTVEAGKDKKSQVESLLAKASTEPNLLGRLNKEAIELTEIGNNFMIRHTETNKTPIGESEHVDYLYHRMFAMIRLLLKTTGRGG